MNFSCKFKNFSVSPPLWTLPEKFFIKASSRRSRRLCKEKNSSTTTDGQCRVSRFLSLASPHDVSRFSCPLMAHLGRTSRVVSMNDCVENSWHSCSSRSTQKRRKSKCEDKRMAFAETSQHNRFRNDDESDARMAFQYS